MRQTSSNSGLTMIEVCIGLMILTVVLGGAIMASERGAGVFRRSMTNSAVNSKSSRALDRIAREIVDASGDSMSPASPMAPFGTDTIEFQRVTGWDGADYILGPVIRIGFEPATGELMNDMDDNGNGLIDEGRVVRTENPGVNERRLVLVNGVSEFLEGELDNSADDNGNGLEDERGLSFDMEGGTLNVRLSVERVDINRQRVVRTVETSIALRN
ncbi:MAG: hypothetical protein GY711_32540 [bacterium]|nr:hypothetical protein [bacterium]